MTISISSLTQTGYAGLCVIFLMAYIIVGIAIAPSTPRHRRKAPARRGRP